MKGSKATAVDTDLSYVEADGGHSKSFNDESSVTANTQPAGDNIQFLQLINAMVVRRVNAIRQEKERAEKCKICK